MLAGWLDYQGIGKVSKTKMALSLGQTTANIDSAQSPIVQYRTCSMSKKRWMKKINPTTAVHLNRTVAAIRVLWPRVKSLRKRRIGSGRLRS